MVCKLISRPWLGVVDLHDKSLIALFECLAGAKNRDFPSAYSTPRPSIKASLCKAAMSISFVRIFANALIRRPLERFTNSFDYWRHKAIWQSILPAEWANDKITNLIHSEQPALVSRIGHTEGRIVGEYLFSKARYGRLSRKEAHQFSGIFPVKKTMLTRFAEIYSTALSEVDLLGFWQTAYQARWLNTLSRQPLLVHLESLEPYFYPKPWTASLAGLRVLVVHPFAESIASQYRLNRHALFPNSQILPEFDLEVLAPPQTLAPSTAGYSDWEDAFNSLVAKVLERRFDVALLGCGAYGLPLGAAIKRNGRKAIHLGGSLQILFGIRGRRWDALPLFQPLWNDAWVRPSALETPQSAKSVDSGCYW